MSLLIIDLGSVFWAAWHSSANEEISAAHDRCVNKIRWLRGHLEHEHCAIACDSPRSLRREKYPAYKSNRAEKDKAAIEQLARVKRTLEADALLLWECDGLEADDVIASAVQEANRRNMRVTIASADKDLFQLVSDTVRVFSPKTEVLYDVATVQQKTGVLPRQMRDWLALVGDSSDNVQGVPRVGPKNAAALLTMYDNIEALMLEVARNPEGVATPAISKSLAASTEVIRIAIDLVTLRTDAPIDFEELFQERTVKPLTDVRDAEFEDEAQEDWPIDEAVPDSEKRDKPPAQPADKTPLPKAPTQLPKETALAVRQPRSFELSLQPETIAGAFKLANGLYNSRLYNRFGSPEAIMAVIIRGREMGMGALTSLDLFHVVEGKPAMHAHLIVARAKAHPDCEYFQFLGGDGTYAEFETKNRRNPKVTKLKYTIKEAHDAGVVKPGSNWTKRPAEMLRKTCAVQLARIEYPEATAGLYSIEELDGEAAA